MIVGYRGTAYHGWQWQYAAPNWKGPRPPTGLGIPTVQQELKKAVQHVVLHPVNLVGSSRTDAGVHAKGQVVHFDTPLSQIPADGFRRAINHALPDDILVHTLEPVDSNFHAILNTASKRYEYRIHNALDRQVFGHDLAWHRWHPLDTDAMAVAAERLVGTHDFMSFSKAGHNRETTVRTVLECSVRREGAEVLVGVCGTGFLWHMVRIIVGTLVEVGLGRYDAERVGEMLAARDRRAAGATAPAHGLYLDWVRFGAARDRKSPADDAE